MGNFYTCITTVLEYVLALLRLYGYIHNGKRWLDWPHTRSTVILCIATFVTRNFFTDLDKYSLFRVEDNSNTDKE